MKISSFVFIVQASSSMTIINSSIATPRKTAQRYTILADGSYFLPASRSWIQRFVVPAATSSSGLCFVHGLSQHLHLRTIQHYHFIHLPSHKSMKEGKCWKNGSTVPVWKYCQIKAKKQEESALYRLSLYGILNCFRVLFTFRHSTA